MRWRKPNAEPNSPGTSTTGSPAPAPATVTDTDSCGDTASCTRCEESPNNNTASSNIDPSSGRTPLRPRQRVPSLQVLRRGCCDRAYRPGGRGGQQAVGQRVTSGAPRHPGSAELAISRSTSYGAMGKLNGPGFFPGPRLPPTVRPTAR